MMQCNGSAIVEEKWPILQQIDSVKSETKTVWETLTQLVRGGL